MKQTSLRLIPLIETGLNFFASLFGSDRTVHYTRADAPEFVLEVGFTAREDLVRVADGGFTLLAPAEELVRQRVVQRDFGIAQREEAGQRIGIEAANSSEATQLRKVCASSGCG